MAARYVYDTILPPWPVKDLQLLFPWSCGTPTTLLILNHPKGSSKAGNGSVGYARKHQALIDGIVRNLKFLGEDGSILTVGKSGKVPPDQAYPDEGGIWRRHGQRRL